MVSSTYPDGTPASVNDLQFEILGSQWAADGIVGAHGDSSVVFADSTGRLIKYRAGKHSIVHGHGWSSGSADVTEQIAANGTSYPRIDMAVLGLDRSTTPWRVTQYVKPGTASAAPVAPALIRDPVGAGTGKWEFPLALIAVSAGTTVINPADVIPLSVYCGAQPIVVPSVAVLQQIPAPTNGQTALVMGDANVPVNYLFSTSTGWRRADWNLPWGLIGGKQWSATGALLTGPIQAEVSCGQDTGPVITAAGRRYQVVTRWREQVSLNGAYTVHRVVDTNQFGPQRAALVTPELRATVAGGGALTYQWTMQGEWDEQINTTRTYVHYGYCLGPTGSSMSIFRSPVNYDTDRISMCIYDLGPAPLGLIGLN